MGKSRLLVSGVALAALVLAGCGKADQAGAPGGSGSTAFDSIQALSSAVDAGSSKAQSAHITFTGNDGTNDIAGEGDFSFAGENTAMEMSMNSPDGPVTLRFVDNVVYIKAEEELEPGKPWIKLDLASKNPLTAAFGGMTEQLKQTDPRASLAELTKAGTIKDVSADTVNGVPVTRYTIDVDLAKLAEETGADPAELAKSGVTTLPFVAWIDGNDLPVRFTVEAPVVEGATMKLQMDYTDWGKPVDVQAPPAEQVAELPEF